MNYIDDRPEPGLGGNIEDRMALPIASSGVVSAPGSALPVLDARSLIERVGLASAVRVLRIKLAFPAELFALAAQPLIDGHAEFVQLLPVPGSGRFGQPGGQLSRSFAMAIRALDRRRGQILPRGAAPEVIGAQAYRWTFAVFVAALLRDVPRVCDGMIVRLGMRTGIPRVWNPSEGSMRTCGAFGYRIETLPSAVVSDEGDPALALRLFERCVPLFVRDWLQEDRELMVELRACLSRHASPAGAISALVEPDAPGRLPAQAPEGSPVARVPPVTALDANSAPATAAASSSAPPEFLEEVRAEESLLARQFMAWLGQGVQGGSLPVNRQDGQVYVVAEGLLLASPRIFREFAKQQVTGSESVADAARRVQREVLRAGWHLRADRGVNILCYERGRSGRESIRIHGIVIHEPQRFIQPLPAPDLTMVRLADCMGAPT